MKYSKWTWLFLGAVVVLMLGSRPAWSQDYRFSVPEMKMQVYVLPNASVRMTYDFSFLNDPSAHPIDVVDIGLPHGDYSISQMSASMGGRTLTGIRPSAYVNPGVEVHLEDQTIPPGGKGTLHFEAVMPNLVYQDTTRDDYASLQITPTWFGAQYVTGSGNNNLAIHMIEGVTPDQVLYQDKAFTQKVIFQNRTVVIWQWNAPLTGPHRVGVSFPKTGMNRVVHISKFGLLIRWFEGNPKIQVGYGFVYLILLGLLFFRFSGGTGCALFGILVAGSVLVFVFSTAIQIFSVPALLPVIMLNEMFLRKRKRHKYLPPIAEVAGGGIKRGLTAPEAAVILEEPLGKVLTLVMFGLLKKGVVQAKKLSPLEVTVPPAFLVGKRADGQKKSMRLAEAQKKGVVLHQYEHVFLDLLEKHAGQPVKDIEFSYAMEQLVKKTADRLSGFDLDETKAYYRKIVERAAKQAEGLEVGERERFLDNKGDWIMMDERPERVFDRPDYHYVPIWIRSGGGYAPGDPGLSMPSAPSTMGTPTLGDVAGSYAGWMQNSMGDLASAISPGSLNLPGSSGGFINLGGLDKVTKDVFSALATSGGGRSGGGGGGCACACAGCACACACAGGGR